MQDEERLRERVELALDNRQIFLLFSASAVVLSLVFALGVVVGKRLSPVVAATPKADPLAMLDQAGAAADDDLTFPRALTGAAEASLESPAEGAAGARAAGAKPGQASDTGERVDPAPAAPAAPTLSPKRDAKRKAAREAKLAAARAKAAAKAAERAAERAVKVALAQARASAKQAAEQAAKRAKLAAKRAKLAAKRAAKQAALSKDKAAKAAKMAKADKPGASDEGSYTLQLSSFQDRVEAERFMNTLRQKGHDPQMVPTRIPNRGLWYRVRLGSYPSWQKALAAKRSFETSTKLIAYVARR